MYNSYQGLYYPILELHLTVCAQDNTATMVRRQQEWQVRNSPRISSTHILTLIAPGTGAPPGMVQAEAQSYPQGRQPQQGYPPFAQPQTMPNINFAAPVIRLGQAERTGGPPAGPGGDRGPRRPGLGAGDYRDRDRPAPIQPQTKEEIIRTLFVGGITEGCGGDEGVERILRAAGDGRLRKWFRATDAEEKPCKFGFAEYEDAESLGIAIEVLQSVMVPVKQRSEVKQEIKEEEEEEVEKSQLLVVADESSKMYIDQYEESQGGVDINHKQMLIDQAQDALKAVLDDLENPQARSKEQSNLDRDGDATMQDGENGDVVTIQLPIDDELADIPAEMRETVAKEIAAFRDRSNRRDLERMKREEEIELQERTRMTNGDRSPPRGPANNNPPSGPRGVPTGPRGQTGFAKDYVKGVTFVNGTDVSASSAFDDEDTDASDEELEKRRQHKKQAELEKDYNDQERRWLNRERSRTAAVEREKTRDEEIASRKAAEREKMAKRLKEWDDDQQAATKDDEYYRDKSMWLRNRVAYRQREQATDDADRAAESRELARDNHRRERAGQMADDFMSRQGDLLGRDRDEPSTPTTPRREPARFKLSLGAAAQQRNAATAANDAKRPIADVEGMLEDEEEATEDRRRLIPIQASDGPTQSQDMTDEERAEAAKALAAEIPNEKDALFGWDVQWTYLDADTIDGRLRPFIEKRIMDILGVQEEMLVDVVVRALESKKGPQDIARELEDALEVEEAEGLVKKLWRMVVFFSESGRRGLGA